MGVFVLLCSICSVILSGLVIMLVVIQIMLNKATIVVFVSLDYQIMMCCVLYYISYAEMLNEIQIFYS